MYSLPISVTLAAFTIASAASTDPMKPLVSMSPSASCDINAANDNINVVVSVQSASLQSASRVVTGGTGRLVTGGLVTGGLVIGGLMTTPFCYTRAACL